jgi:3-methyladenine DNA glycosylase Tag
MNNHINQNRRDAEFVNQRNRGEQLKIVDKDHLPKEVATEMLCAPLAHSTNSERKTWREARATVFESKRVAIPQEQKVSVRLQSLTWEKLDRRLHRVCATRENAQRAYKLFQRRGTVLDSRVPAQKTTLVLLERQMSAIELHVAGLDALWEAIENEIERRQNFCKTLSSLTPSVAKALRRKLCGYAAKG